MISLNFPDIHLLYGNGELWWSGAMNIGIKYACSVVPQIRSIIIFGIVFCYHYLFTSFLISCEFFFTQVRKKTWGFSRDDFLMQQSKYLTSNKSSPGWIIARDGVTIIRQFLPTHINLRRNLNKTGSNIVQPGELGCGD